MTEYETKTKIELVALCKERGVKGYSSAGMTKDKIIRLLKDNVEYNSVSRKVNYLQKKNASCEKTLRSRRLKTNLFDYLTLNNLFIIAKFVGTHDELKNKSHGTNQYLTWKCDTPNCLNTFKAIPRNVLKKEEQRKYCDTCTHQNRQINKQIAILNRSGSIQDKYPLIKDVWSIENKKEPTEFSPGSNERVKLICPNKSAKHPEYEIDVCKIQAHT